MRKVGIIVLACAASLSSAAIAQESIAVTGGNGTDFSARVLVSDLNLQEAKDKVALRSRVREAVVAVCATDAACNYTTERSSARLVANAIASANGQLAEASPTHLTIRAAR